MLASTDERPLVQALNQYGCGRVCVVEAGVELVMVVVEEVAYERDWTMMVNVVHPGELT